MADLQAEGQRVDRDRLEWIHARKTGALFAASAELGGIVGGADGAARRALADYGYRLGLAFQIVDDLLDLTGTAEQLGKTPGKDLDAREVDLPRVDRDRGLPGGGQAGHR